MNICKIENCKDKYEAKGYCKKHYNQIKNWGKILKNPVRKRNEIVDKKDYSEIILYKRMSNGENPECNRTQIDKEDVYKIKNFKWRLCSGRPCTSIKLKTIALSQFLLGKKDGLEIDHIDGNPLNNRKKNLRYCSHQNNARNNPSKGYCFSEKIKKWRTYINVDNKQIYLGNFDNEIDARRTRKNAEEKFFGKYARKNKYHLTSNTAISVRK